MKQILEEQVESKREELIVMAMQKGLSSVDVLLISEELDFLINQYNSLENEDLYGNIGEMGKGG
ncbi:aspartyl-phosphate phosphatase Spo0E family protein [Sporosarcina highlanderae]|uniref:Aspartyl-phosphate phosphatase Spo0E family protein n=1 Tax=Sporosarcina highlanderae TaxID=3035916 RepID=A0ABT8JSJ7_9BACL|nr:aspartyl-phosphate phosphatase Spo0E family protein [Sporosarcina highlanderae]MDN4607977.1 aspartyl-phosphate phosphatase Spo0E family protein [Sporosarcina highlanderae]